MKCSAYLSGNIVVCLLLGTVRAPLWAQEANVPVPAETLYVSLATCVERALTLGEEMGLAEADRIAAIGQYRQARADALPQLSLNASYTRQFESIYRQEGSFGDIRPFEPDTLAPLEERVRDLEIALPTAPLASLSGLFSGPFGSEHRYGVTLGVTQKVFEGGSIVAAVRAAKHALRAFENRRDDSALEVRLLVREAYLAALLADRSVEIATLGLQQADTQLQRVRARQEVGQSAEFDLLQAEVQRDNQLPLVRAALNARSVAYLQLAALANLPANTPLVLTTPLLAEVTLPEEPLAAIDTTRIFADALSNIGISALEEELQARRQAITVAGRDSWPALSLFGTYSNQAYPSDGWPNRGDWIQDVSAGASFNWFLFDGLRSRGAVQTSRAQASMSEYNLQKAREAIQLVVDLEIGELLRAAELLRSRARTVQLALRAQELATLRFEEGASSLLEVEDARNALQVAQLSEASARHDYLLALARLERYTGRPLFTDVARQVGGD
jgi:outer membrane protein TolC